MQASHTSGSMRRALTIVLKLERKPEEKQKKNKLEQPKNNVEPYEVLIAVQITVIACVLELCRNFEPLVLARTTTYWYEAKTYRSHVIGAHFGPKTRGKKLA